MYYSISVHGDNSGDTSPVILVNQSTLGRSRIFVCLAGAIASMDSLKWLLLHPVTMTNCFTVSSISSLNSERGSLIDVSSF